MHVQPAATYRLADSLALHEPSSARRRAAVERSKSVFGAAIAAARSDKERQLLVEIFDCIPKVLALSEAHSALEDACRESDLAERRWVRALSQVQAKLSQLINLPVESADDAHRRLSIWREVNGKVGLPDAKKALDGLGREDLQVLADAALKAIKSLADPKPTAADRIWAEALDRFRKAEADQHAPGLSDDDWEGATDRACEMEGQLHRTPAPTIAALAEKMRLTLKLQIEDEREDDVDDPRTIAVGLADDDCVVREQVLAYQDALRLSGQRPEIVAVTPFDPAPFIQAATAADIALDVVEDADGLLVLAPFMAPDDVEASSRNDLFEALNRLRQGELRVLRRRLHDDRRSALQ